MLESAVKMCGKVNLTYGMEEKFRLIAKRSLG